MITRRSLVRGSAVTLAGAIVARPMAAMRVERFQELPSSDDARMKQLIDAAIDAAKSAGASYADARLTFTQELTYLSSFHVPSREETIGIGVRALYDGYWGFAASPVWEASEAARLGRAAVANAKANVQGQVREIELPPQTATQSGDWIMPVKDDPFEMAFEEIYDYVKGLASYTGRLGPKFGYITSAGIICDFIRQHKAFGSSQGQFVTQRLYRTGGSVNVLVQEGKLGGRSVSGQLDQLTLAGMGFEYFRGQPLRQYIAELVEELIEEMKLPIIPVDVGRYPILIDGAGMADIVSQSIGVATEVDRVMGYEANAGGTSYIIDPSEMLGTFKVGAPMLQVSASRSQPGGCAHVRWDDEGVTPREFPIVKDGLLVNLQTNREGSGWIKPYYTRSQQPFASFGCAYTPDAIEAPLVHSADLTVRPAPNEGDGLDVLRQAMERGIEWKRPMTSFDFQQITGMARGKAFDIKKGQRTALIVGAGMLFRTTELWNNLIQLGGRVDARQVGLLREKGEPQRRAAHSCEAPPGVFKDISIIDYMRKA